ncbi:MAG: hypothetical protein ACR2QA_10085 [Solirubrobacteraceae bacterium]
MTLVLRSGWAEVPFIKGYTRVVALTAAERERLPDLLFTRQLIDRVFGVCRNPHKAVATAKKLTAVRRESEAKARELLNA